MKNLFFALVLIFPLVSFSQNYIYIGTNRYKATNNWECYIDGGYPEFGGATLSVAKNGSGGFFIVSVDTHHPLKGAVYIYLKNGEVIKCLDTKNKDQHDGYSIGIYNLTASEIEKLKKSDIESVRVSCFMYSYDWYSFTIENYQIIETWLGDKLPMYNPSAEEVTKLMSN
jgi:hypothetical protein